MELGDDSQTPERHNSVAEALRVRDPATTTEFQQAWISAVTGYCSVVCEPQVLDDAVKVAFSDFFQKVAEHPVDDANLVAALLRSTRITAAEVARIDWHLPGAPDEGDDRSLCEMTPLWLAGHPDVTAGVVVSRRSSRHIEECRRCQSTEARFHQAPQAFRPDTGPGRSEAPLDPVPLPPVAAGSEAAEEQAAAEVAANDVADPDEARDADESSWLPPTSQHVSPSGPQPAAELAEPADVESDWLAAFCHTWSDPVFAYCSEVCGTERGAQATAIACADAVEKLRWLSPSGTELPAAVLSSARLAASALMEGAVADGRRLDIAEQTFWEAPAGSAPPDVVASALAAARDAGGRSEPRTDWAPDDPPDDRPSEPGERAVAVDADQWLLPEENEENTDFDTGLAPEDSWEPEPSRPPGAAGQARHPAPSAPGGEGGGGLLSRLRQRRRR